MVIYLKKQIHGCFASVSSEDVWIEKSVYIPTGLSPFKGLFIEVGDDAEEIKEIIVKREVVVCYVQSDDTFCNVDNFLKAKTPEEQSKFDKLVQSYLDKGWVKS